MRGERLLLLIAALLPATAWARPFELEGAKRKPNGYVEVDREVEFLPGDSPVPTAASVQFGTLVLPAPHATGWFRVELDVSPAMVARGVHLVLFTLGAAELHLDGKLAQTYGDMGAALRDERTDVTTRFRIDRAVRIEQPGRHSVAIRLAIAPSDVGTLAGGISPGVVLLAGDRDSLETFLAWRRGLDVLLIFFVGAALSLAVLHFLLFLFMGRGQPRTPRTRAHREFAVMSAMLLMIPLSAFMGSDTTTAQQLELVYTVNKAAIVLTTLFGLRFYYAAFSDRSPKWIKLFVALGVVLAVLARIVPEPAVMVYAIIALAEQLRIIIRAVLRKQSGAWIVGVGGAASVLTGIIQAIDSLTIDSLSFATGIPEFFYLYGFLVLLLSISIYLARDFAREERARLRSEAEAARKEVLLEESRKREVVLKDLEVANLRLRSTQAQLVQSEKMAALGQLVAGIAHEVNTPVGAISSMQQSQAKAIERLTARLDGEDELRGVLRVLSDGSRVIGTASERINTIVKRLRAFARLDEATLKLVDVHEGIDDSLMLLQHELRDRITVHRSYGEIPKVECYAGQLNQVFLNLLVNAAQAISDKGEIRISTAVSDGMLHVAIHDTGSGIAPENLSRVFDPGFTTKGVRVGTGLGLAICYQIVEQHAGRITAESELGKGTTFEVRIPTTQRS